MTEVWTIADDQRSAQVTGRSKIAFWTKCNPVFWFRNDFNQTVEQAPWYEPDKPLAERQRDWALRNPAQNFRSVVFGVMDKNYSVRGKHPVLTAQRNDLHNADGSEQTGWQWCVLYGGDLWLPRFWLSYSGRVVAYYGTQPNGFWGAKFNIHKEGSAYSSNSPT